MAVETENRNGSVNALAVVNEPRVYEADGPHSFYQDIGAAAAGMFQSENYERLLQHRQQVQWEIEHRTPYGLAAAKELRTLKDYEERAASTTTMAGFATPQWLTEYYALYRGVHRSFVDQTDLLPIPRVGMTLHVPALGGGTTITFVSENSVIADSSGTLTGSDLNSGFPVGTASGQYQYSIQLHDRAMTGGGSFDAVVAAQLQQQLDQAVDVYALTQAISLGSAVAGSGTYAASWSGASAATQWGSFMTDLAAAREVMTDTAGNRWRPTHMFTTSDFESFVTRQLDAQGRPILLPNETPGQAPESAAIQDNSRWAGYTGLIMPGAVRWFFDDNIPATGGNTQIIIARPDTIMTFEGTPALHLYPQTAAGNLLMTAQLMEYVAVVPRFPSAVAVLTGAQYPTTLK